MTKVVGKPIIDAALGKKPDRYPVWFLRQAGRYLPEYREIRAQLTFLERCQNPQVAAEVTLQPLRRFDLDGSIIFSDILIPPTAMGQTLTFAPDHGPVITPVVRTAADLKKLIAPDITATLGYVGEAIKETKKQLRPNVAMIGFAGAPFTVASYMIEGSGSKNYTEVKKMMYNDPQTFDGLLNLLSKVTVDYLEMQIAAGAEIVMLFDSWAGNLTARDYRQHVVPVMKSLIDELKTRTSVPVIYYPGQGSDNLAELSGLKMDVVHIDWRTRISRAARILKEAGCDVTLQGNIDPQIFLGPEALVRQRVRDIVREVKESDVRGHIFNVGHGLMPHTPMAALGWVIEELRTLSP